VGYIGQSQPHYIENLGDTDLVFLEVFPTGEYQDISLAEWLAHTPSRLVDQHIGTGEGFLAKLSKRGVVGSWYGYYLPVNPQAYGSAQHEYENGLTISI
jgi:hypothetical protein